jgi:putative membrane protein
MMALRFDRRKLLPRAGRLDALDDQRLRDLLDSARESARTTGASLFAVDGAGGCVARAAIDVPGTARERRLLNRCTPRLRLVASKGVVPMNTRVAYGSFLAVILSLLWSGGVLAKELSKDDTQFLNKAAQGGHAEVESSKLAQSRAKNSNVKSFASQMITDHSKAGNELRQLAESKGVKVANEPSVAQKEELKVLSESKDEQFDKSFAESFGVKAHEETVKLFKDAATHASDPDVKAFAQKTLPTLQHHLEMAKSMNAVLEKGSDTKISGPDKKS